MNKLKIVIICLIILVLGLISSIFYFNRNIENSSNESLSDKYPALKDGEYFSKPLGWMISLNLSGKIETQNGYGVNETFDCNGENKLILISTYQGGENMEGGFGSDYIADCKGFYLVCHEGSSGSRAYGPFKR